MEGFRNYFGKKAAYLATQVGNPEKPDGQFPFSLFFTHFSFFSLPKLLLLSLLFLRQFELLFLILIMLECKY